VDRESPPTSGYAETSGAKAERAWLDAADDDTLLAIAREGQPTALAELYRRHRADALRYASRMTRRHLGYDRSDDVFAEAIRKVLTALGRGHGPRTGFRAYLFTAIRTVTLSESKNPSVLTEHGRIPDPAVPEPDQAVDAAHIAMRAFARLPQRWRQVLWTTKVDQVAPNAAGSLLGMRPNSVAALAMRARGALRIAYIREHLPRPAHRTCRNALDLVARRSVVPIPAKQDAVLREHLGECHDCAAAVETIEAQIARWMRSSNWGPTVVAFRRHHLAIDDRRCRADDVEPPYGLVAD
jgi:RNA polymerase sigma factor (sigma-70 family)